MSTVDRPERKVLPPLTQGQRLDQLTFHERYEAMPPGIWAELVGGMVYMASPLFYDHGGADDEIGGWLFHYRVHTPGLSGAANASTKLSSSTEVQPDRQLRIRAENGGQSRIEGGYVVGPPELIVEIADSSRLFDLGPKKLDYERFGVLEYLFYGLDPAEIRWFTRHQDTFSEIHPNVDGLLRSVFFPGLWLDPNALIRKDLPRLIAALDQGLATREHAAFVARLAAAAGQA